MKPVPPSSDPTDTGSRVRPLDWARVAGEEALVEQEMRAEVRRRRHRRLATLGAAAVAALVVGFVWRDRIGIPVARPASGLLVAEPRQETLPDGSIVDLLGAAQVSVEFTPSFRRVVLQTGEAHFRVAKNPERPFVVVAGGVEVRAVGTAFSVQLGMRGVDVLVTEGRVAVAEMAGPSAAAPRPVFVDAGQGVSVVTSVGTGGSAVVRTVPSSERAERLAWRVPQLDLNSTPLAAVIPLVNAHVTTPVRLADPTLGELKLSGTLRADNVPVLLQILATSYGVTAEPEAGGGFLLHRAR